MPSVVSQNAGVVAAKAVTSTTATTAQSAGTTTTTSQAAQANQAAADRSTTKAESGKNRSISKQKRTEAAFEPQELKKKGGSTKGRQLSESAYQHLGKRNLSIVV